MLLLLLFVLLFTTIVYAALLKFIRCDDGIHIGVNLFGLIMFLVFNVEFDFDFILRIAFVISSVWSIEFKYEIKFD